MTKVRFEAETLAHQGSGLAGTVTAPAEVPMFGAPAGDPVSLNASAALNAHVAALGLVVEHSAAVRAHGGAVVAATAAALEGVDRGNAADIGAVAGGARPGGAPTPPAGVGTPLPELPPMPVIPTLPAAPVLPGEQWSTLIHGGPGSSGLRSFADALRAHAGALRDTSDEVRNHADLIDENWFDGVQQAGANTERHGRWLSSAAEHARTIAAAADQVADSFDQARTAVPPPHDFQQARQEVLDAQRAGNPVAASVASQKYTWLHTQALDGVLVGYHPTTTSTLTGLPQPLSPAPAIAPGADAGTQPASVGPDDVIVGPDSGPRIVPVDNTTGPANPVTPVPGGQPQIGPFPVPPEVAAKVPPNAVPRPADPTGGLLMPQNLPPASPPPNIPGVGPAAPGVPSLPAPKPAAPGCGFDDWSKGIAEAGAGPIAILTAAPEGATGVGIPIALGQIALGYAATVDGLQIIARCTGG